MITGKKFYDSLPKKSMGAGAIILDKEGRVLIVKTSYKISWSLPGGVVEANESPRMACQREVFEEVGLRLKIDRMLGVNYNSPNREMPENLQWIFWGGIVDETQKRLIKIDNDEIVEFGFFEPKKAIELAGLQLANKLELFEIMIKEKSGIYLEDWNWIE